jgi:GNAT superfamily N-acetyltransferase
MGNPDIERITAFEHRFARAQATDVVELPWGFAVLQTEFPLSQFHNRIVVTSTAPPADVLATTEAVLGEAGVGARHRYVSADDAQGRAMRDELVAAGYEHEVIVTMVHSGKDIGAASHEVREVSLETLRPAIVHDWRVTLPDADDEQLHQLADRTALYARGAEVALLAVFDGDTIAAHADLYLDHVDHLAQFENLSTHEDFRRRGYGAALVRDALRRAIDAGSELTFLTADLDDWPRDWYGRLGYVEAGRSHHFVRRD